MRYMEIIDGRDVPNPEDVAMLQALYSRSAASVRVHIDKVRAGGSSKFTESYVVGFNHKSIADCGSTTIFIEGVSMLAAKAIQDWPLYSGQETSTRYVDMANQPTIDVLDGWGGIGSMPKHTQPIIERWMNFYRANQERVANIVRERYPRRPDEDPKKYDYAVKARRFDILRGFLPAGITTQLSWHTNLRQAGDHLNLLSEHPSVEVRCIAHEVQKALHEKYPDSGFDKYLPTVTGVTGGDDERWRWSSNVAQQFSYQNEAVPLLTFASSIAHTDLRPYHEMLDARPRGCALPHFLTDLGQLSFGFDLDFGSFRDLQRHRNGVCRMPMLTTTRGFEPWYLEQLDEELRAEASALVEEQAAAINRLTHDQVARQYYIAMGFRVPCRVTFGLPAAVYVMELRSNKTIHATLRRVVHEKMIAPFVSEYPEVKLHVDMDPDDWTVRRGAHTIEERRK